MKAVVIEVDRPPQVVHVAASDGRLEAYERLVGGPVVLYCLGAEAHVYFRASSSTSYGELPLNELATALVSPVCGRAVHGMAVVVGTGPCGVDVDAPPAMLTWARQHGGDPR